MIPEKWLPNQPITDLQLIREIKGSYIYFIWYLLGWTRFINKKRGTNRWLTVCFISLSQKHCILSFLVKILNINFWLWGCILQVRQESWSPGFAAKSRSTIKNDSVEEECWGTCYFSRASILPRVTSLQIVGSICQSCKSVVIRNLRESKIHWFRYLNIDVISALLISLIIIEIFLNLENKVNIVENSLLVERVKEESIKLSETTFVRKIISINIKLKLFFWEK